MSHAEAATMKRRLLDAAVTGLERAVLIDMAEALEKGSTVYAWGHGRLAEAIGKRPGTRAAKAALSQRIIPALIAKGLIEKVGEAHRGRNAEYDLLVLHAEWVPVMGTGTQAGKGTGFEGERVPVSTPNGYRFRPLMGTGLIGTPATYTATYTATGTAKGSADAAQPKKSKPLLPLPEDWTPSQPHRDRARSAGLNLVYEVEQFTNHARAQGRRAVDWDAAFMMWLSKSAERAKPQTKPMPVGWTPDTAWKF